MAGEGEKEVWRLLQFLLLPPLHSMYTLLCSPLIVIGGVECTYPVLPFLIKELVWLLRWLVGFGA